MQFSNQMQWDHKNIVKLTNMKLRYYSCCVVFLTFVCLVYCLKIEIHPDRDLTITQTLIKHGYRVETHDVITKDGYIITVYRIPAPRNSTRFNGYPVMIVPGTCGCSENFIIAGPQKAIAYYLADRGFDVWLMNTRGNRHARRHITIDPRDRIFWDFGWHEVAIYDTPALVDYVLNVTGRTDLFYIGHSQGTTSFFAFLAEKPEYNKKIRLSIQMAPSCFLSDTKSLVKLMGKHSSLIQAVTNYLDIHEIFPNKSNDIVNLIAKTLCSETSILVDLCLAILYFGQLSPQMDPITPQLVFQTSPARCSVKELIHYFQIVDAGVFRKFNYGTSGNIKLYGSRTPPLYNLSNIASPVSLFYAPSDNLVPYTGVRKLAATLPHVALLYEVPTTDFNHVDFIFGRNVVELVNEPLYKLLMNYL